MTKGYRGRDGSLIALSLSGVNAGKACLFTHATHFHADL